MVPPEEPLICERFAACFVDTRMAELVEHQVETMVMQRVVAIALGYEDLNDHDDLRREPALAVLASKLEVQRSDCAPQAGKSTLTRRRSRACSLISSLTPNRSSPSRSSSTSMPPTIRCMAARKASSSAVMELVLGPAKPDPRNCYCCLPLHIFCGRHLLAAKLRRSNIDGAAGSVEEVARIAAQIRRRWPGRRILLRGDSGFTREALMAWCEANRVDFVLGPARNDRLEKASVPKATPRNYRVKAVWEKWYNSTPGGMHHL